MTDAELAEQMRREVLELCRYCYTHPVFAKFITPWKQGSCMYCLNAGEDVIAQAARRGVAVNHDRLVAYLHRSVRNRRLPKQRLP